jgi:hypothetical protein
MFTGRSDGCRLLLVALIRFLLEKRKLLLINEINHAMITHAAQLEAQVKFHGLPFGTAAPNHNPGNTRNHNTNR